MDVDSASTPRVLIKKIKTDTPAREVTYQESASKERETCTELIGEVVRALQSEHPIKMRQEAHLIDSTYLDVRKKRSPDVTTFNIKRDRGGRIFTEQSGTKVKDFCSSCPITSPLQSNTSVFTLPMAIKCGEDDKCVADLRIEARFLEIDPGANFTIGSYPSVTLVVTVTNYQETAIGPEVIISFARRSLKSVPKTCKHIPMELSSSYQCSLGRFLEQDGAVSVSMEFEMSDLVAGRQGLENEYIFHIEATTASEMLQPAALDLVLPLVVSADTHLYASRKVMKFNEKTLQPYQISSHIYEVRLKGPSPMSSLQLSFQFPVNLTRTLDSMEVVQVLHAKAEIDGVDVHCQATNGKFYQKLSESLEGKAASSEFQPDPNLDAVLVGESKERDIRKKRDTHHIAPRIIRKKQMTLERTIYFECTSRFVDCMEIICTFPEFRPSSRGSVTIGFRVSSDTVRKMFEEERADVLIIASQGAVSMPTDYEDVQMYNDLPDTDDSSTTVVLETPKKVSKWIIVGSIVMGILLLFLICLCFYALGCLKRNKREVETTEDADEVDAVIVAGNQDDDFDDSDDEVPEHIPEKPSLIDGLAPITEEHEEHSS
ncbi:unnamed protein product [Allacma fusca]|uniref:Uncharacterized protein n=1 Tax=Allacma fusca TaxID=39272 RepID=A0A8J2JYR1_9HEXA|nr:unnamed protein product [Allacma fusca]